MERAGKYPRWLTLAGSMLAIAALYFGRPVLIPFALALLISFLLSPLVARLQRWRFGRLPAVLTAVLVVTVATGATSWFVVGQLRDVTTKLSEYKSNIRTRLATMQGVVAKPMQSASEFVAEIGDGLAPESRSKTAKSRPVQTVRIEEEPRGPFEVLSDAFSPLAELLMTIALALLFAFVMLLQHHDLGDRFIRMVGHNQILLTTRALDETAQKVGTYLRRLVLLNGIHGCAVWIGLMCLGVPNALLWGTLSALLRFLPYIGPWIGATCPVLTSIATSSDWTQPLCTIGLFALLELVSNNVLEPWIYGRGTGLSPLAVLVSSLFWTWLWGPIGLVLSTPLTVCLVVVGKYVPQLQFLHLLFGDAPGLAPHERLYQRIVAGEQDQAWAELQAQAQHKSLHDVYDAVLLPALSMAEADRQRGELDLQDEARIDETLRLLIDEAAELRASPSPEPSSSSTPSPATSAVTSPVPSSVPIDPLRVHCVPAHGSSDALAARMLRHVLARDGVRVDVSSTRELSGETLDVLADGHADIVIVSAVPPSQFMHMRYSCKRIASRYPTLPIVAGMWILEPDKQALEQRLPLPPNVQAAASMSAARALVQQLGEAARLRREPRTPTLVAALR